VKIYDFEGFPNPARVRIALAEKGVTDRIEFIPVNVPAGEHRKPEFLAKNPSSAVPVLELEDGTCISECTGSRSHDAAPCGAKRYGCRRGLVSSCDRGSRR